MHLLKLIEQFQLLQKKKTETIEKKNELRQKQKFFFHFAVVFDDFNRVKIFQDIKYIFKDYLSQLVIWFKKYYQNKNINKFT